jgi:hypothetical protein
VIAGLPPKPPSCASTSSNALGHLDARFHQVTKEFSHQQDVGFLEFVIVAKLELIRVGHDQTVLGLAQNAFLLQAIGTPPHGFDRYPQKPTGALYSADKFNLLLTGKRLDSQAVAGDG